MTVLPLARAMAPAPGTSEHAVLGHEYCQATDGTETSASARQHSCRPMNYFCWKTCS